MAPDGYHRSSSGLAVPYLCVDPRRGHRVTVLEDPPATLVQLTGGRRLLRQHWAPGRALHELARNVEVLTCCYPARLPDWARAKHLFPDADEEIISEWTGEYYYVYPASWLDNLC